jgi:hypothetical protein
VLRALFKRHPERAADASEPHIGTLDIDLALDFSGSLRPRTPHCIERYEPGVRLTFARSPHYFVSDIPYADAVEVTVDADPASRLAPWLAGRYEG